MPGLKQWVLYAYVAALVWFGLLAVPYCERQGPIACWGQYRASLWSGTGTVAVDVWLVQLIVTTAIFVVVYYIVTHRNPGS